MLSFVKKKGISDQKVIRGKNIILSRFWRSVCYFSIRIFFDSSSGKHGFHFPIIAVVWLLSQVRLFATPRTVARQASLSFTSTLSLLRLTSIGLMMPSNHLILCHPLLLLPSIFPSIGVFSNKSALCTRMPPCHQVAKLWSREQHVLLTQDGPVESPGGGKTTDPGKQAVACS